MVEKPGEKYSRQMIYPKGSATCLKFILPHHALDGFIGLTAVFSIFLLTVLGLDLSFNWEVDQLTYGHTFVDLYRLFNGDLQCPVAAEANIAFPCRRMDIDSQAPGR